MEQYDDAIEDMGKMNPVLFVYYILLQREGLNQNGLIQIRYKIGGLQEYGFQEGLMYIGQVSDIVYIFVIQNGKLTPFVVVDLQQEEIGRDDAITRKLLISYELAGILSKFNSSAITFECHYEDACFYVCDSFAMYEQVASEMFQVQFRLPDGSFVNADILNEVLDEYANLDDVIAACREKTRKPDGVTFSLADLAKRNMPKKIGSSIPDSGVIGFCVSPGGFASEPKK